MSLSSKKYNLLNLPDSDLCKQPIPLTHQSNLFYFFMKVVKWAYESFLSFFWM